MLRVVAQSLSRDVQAPPPLPAEGPSDERSLLAPLSLLLASGGDDRLSAHPETGMNAYGCASYPQPSVTELASSTATTISERAFNSIERARFALLGQAQDAGLGDAFETRVIDMRQELRVLLGIESAGTEIVFAPSGTDSALHATFLMRESRGGPLVNIMMAPEETGSGVPFASLGRHFSGQAALGPVVSRGEPIQGFSDDISFVTFAARNENGEPFAIDRIDQAVIELVESATASGANVLLNAMDCSRTGLAGPSLECLDLISSRWPDTVRILVDACQMRLSRARLRQYLSRNHVVMVTGSKYFTGPAFSGALLVPESLCYEFARISRVPSGLRAYTGKSSWPRSWGGIRAGLSPKTNYGEWLRWEAALEEMRAYFSVPSSFRTAGLRKLEAGLSEHLAKVEGVEAVSASQANGGSIQSIFPFYLTAGGRPLTLEQSLQVHNALNDDILSATARGPVSLGEVHPAYRLGQPVPLKLDNGAMKTGAFRISASARMISEAWNPSDPKESEERLVREIQKFGAALEHAASIAVRIP